MDIDEDLITCPITCQIFLDPVTAEDGQTYEKTAILNWLETKSTSPITRAKISDKVYPNFTILNLVENFLKNHPEKKRDQFNLDTYHLQAEVCRKLKNAFGWSDAEAKKAWHVWERCMQIKGNNPELSLSPILDQVWHFAVLNTRWYATWCGEEFIHHSTTSDTDDLEDKNSRINALRTLYLEKHGEADLKLDWLWDRESNSDEIFVIYLETLTGISKDVYLPSDANVRQLFMIVHKVLVIPIDQMRLRYNGTDLNMSSQKLNDFGFSIDEPNKVCVILKLSGC